MRRFLTLAVVLTGTLAAPMSLVAQDAAASLREDVGVRGDVVVLAPIGAPSLFPVSGHGHSQPLALAPLAPSLGLLGESQGGALALQQRRSRRWEGALTGAVAFGVATHLFLYSGDSTSLCNRDRNQDAIRVRECNAITAGSAVVGAGVGYLVGSRIR
jgi:hypothetical protein